MTPDGLTGKPLERFVASLAAFNRRLGRVELFLATLFLGLLVAANTVAVAGRVLFQLYPSWIIEVSSALVIWSVFAGSAYLYKARRHIAVTLLVDRLRAGGTARQAVGIAGEVLVLVFVLVTLWQAAIYQPILAERLTTALQVPQNVVTIAIPIAYVSILLAGLESLLAQLFKLR